MSLEISVRFVAGPLPETDNNRIPRLAPPVMKFCVTATPLQASASTTCVAVDAVNVFRVITAEAVLARKRPLPFEVNVLLETMTFDCAPATLAPRVMPEL